MWATCHIATNLASDDKESQVLTGCLENTLRTSTKGDSFHSMSAIILPSVFLKEVYPGIEESVVMPKYGNVFRPTTVQFKIVGFKAVK